MRQDVQVVQAMVDLMVGIEKFSYPARQNGAPKPKGEFAHIKLLEEYPVGIPNEVALTQTEEVTTSRIYSPARLRLRIGIVDTTGLASMKIMHGWNTEEMKALMISTGYGFIKCDPISNEDAKLENEWEYRQGFSLEVYCTRTIEQTVDNMTAIQVSGKFLTDAGDFIELNYNINKD